MSDRLRHSAALWSTVGAIALIGFWEGFVRWRGVRRFVLLPPSDIVRSFADTPRYYLDHLWVTAWHLVAGVTIALGVSLVLGAALAAWRPLEHAMQPFLVLVLVTPWVAYISSIVLWLGRGDQPIVFLVAFVGVPAFVYAAVAGMRSADPAARELLASIDASRLEVLWRLRLPAALPSLFTAARFNIGLGLAAAYFAEGSSGTTSGLGNIGRRAINGSNGDILWTTILVTALLGILGQITVVALERWLIHWHASQRAYMALNE
jgi:NitT/TauT family transport system permease protein